MDNVVGTTCCASGVKQPHLSQRSKLKLRSKKFSFTSKLLRSSRYELAQGGNIHGQSSAQQQCGKAKDHYH